MTHTDIAHAHPAHSHSIHAGYSFRGRRDHAHLSGVFLIDNSHIHARHVAEAAFNPAVRIELSAEAIELIGLSRDVVDQAIVSGRKIYGLNTLLGSGRDTVVEDESILTHQIQVVRYHDSGVGEYLSPTEVRALILARLIGFSRGGSGVRTQTARLYQELLNRGVCPAVPREGSVGSSDLTQLAAVAAVAIGEGYVLRGDVLVPGAQALADAGLEPLHLDAGEALAMISANSYSIGSGALVLGRLLRLAELADVALALSLEATARYDGGGNLSPFSPVIQAAKAIDGQRRSAATVRWLLRGGWLEDARSEVSTQDPLSFRAAPQTHGAFREQLSALEAALEVELNGRGDNPLCDVESALMVSGGNFQPMQLALAFETTRIALAHVGIASERRIAKLYPPQRTIRQRNLEAARQPGLETQPRPQGQAGTDIQPGPRGEASPGLAVEDLPGLLWYSAAGLLAELKALAAPATLGAPTLSADVEDHSTMAPLALQQLERSVAAAEKLLTIEALTAAYLVLETGDATARDTAAATPARETPAGDQPAATGARETVAGDRRPLGKGTGAVVGHLADVLAQRLPAAALVQRARGELRVLLDTLDLEEGEETQ
ncbi:aromatic amino acid ammonia-lyase [Arthrobacter sp. ISL-30]|uniref:aromatic amino acid ammonia-lyase n=1 Tax=Arthrobacter sp. ISL-30 TaxID=2819109 RepID=UPI001BE9D658|nr:aromatic amino acid ammonia-lyase [Arthrobacter sp. ISL-30]MBT2512261.1 aromatic amino acid lyase [Arthrobacter sp. ISL-30]